MDSDFLFDVDFVQYICCCFFLSEKIAGRRICFTAFINRKLSVSDDLGICNDLQYRDDVFKWMYGCLRLTVVGNEISCRKWNKEKYIASCR